MIAETTDNENGFGKAVVEIVDMNVSTVATGTTSDDNVIGCLVTGISTEVTREALLGSINNIFSGIGSTSLETVAVAKAFASDNRADTVVGTVGLCAEHLISGVSFIVFVFFQAEKHTINIKLN